MAFSTPPRKIMEAGKVSPIVKQTAQQKTHIVNSRSLYTWSAVNLVAAVLLFCEFYFKHIEAILHMQSTLLYSCILALAVLFTLNALVDFIQAVNASFSMQPVFLSSDQKRLMGISNSDPNFSTISPQASQKPATVTAQPHKTPSLLNLVRPIQQSSTPVSADRLNSSHSPSPSSSFHTTTGTPAYQGNVTGASQYSPHFDHSYNKTSPIGHSLDASSFLDSSGGSPFLRHRRSPMVNSPLSSDDFITDKKTLNNYLKSQFERDQSKAHLYGIDGSPSGNQGYWSFNSSLHDYGGELSKNVYQLSTRSPKSPTRSKNNKDDPSKIAALEYWTQAGVDSACLVEWIGRLRRWITITVLRGIVKEINKINEQLKHLGCPEVQIGESSLSALRQIQQSKTSQIPKLTWMLPYLEVTPNQEYLVDRIRTLASGGYMSEYRWDKGGSVQGREWTDEVLTDSALVIHMFCTYMDTHMPPHPRYPDGKTFTSQFFVQSPSKATPGSDVKMQIFQSKFHPPHYQLLTSETTYNPPPGRHNLFATLLLFFHWIKTKESSMLGQVNLGLSGINILSVIEPVTRIHDDVTMASRAKD